MKTATILALALMFGCATSKKGDSQSYVGLGKESLSQETVSRFSPEKLPPELSRKIQTAMDVRAPGMGMLTEDGRTMFFGWRVTGTNQVWKLSSPKAFPVQMTGGEDTTSLQDVSPDGEWLVLSRDRAGEENPGLYLQRAAGGELLQVQHKEKIQTFFEFMTKDSKYLFYRANDIIPDSYAIYRYDLKEKKTELIFSEPGIWSVADFFEEKNAITFLFRKSLGSLQYEYYIWNQKDQKLVPVLGQGDLEDFDAQFGASKDKLFVVTSKFSDLRRLYLYDLESRKFQHIKFTDNLEISQFSIDEKRERILLSLNFKGYERVKALDLKTLKEIPLPKFPENTLQVYFGGTTRNGRFTTFGAETARAPRSNFVYDWQTKKLVSWVVASSPEVDLGHFTETALESFRTRDEVSVPMFVLRPPQCRTQACPVIVDFHGGPEGQSRPYFSPIKQLFIDEGFIYVEPNVRGSTGYGKKWRDADNGPKRLSVITDIEDVAIHIKKHWSRDGVAPKIGITGGSYGGYSTLMGMTYFSGTYDAGVAVVGMSNLKSFLLNTAPYRRKLRVNEYGDPEKDSEALIKLSPITYVEKVKSPLMIIQGVSDPRVPAGEAIQIYEKLKSRGVSAKLILFGDEGHGAQKRENIVSQYGHIIEFFKTHLM